MSARPNCLNTSDCAAKTPGKHCHKCMMTARNKSDRQRTLNGVHKKANCPFTPEVFARSKTPEAIAKSNLTKARRRFPWCPDEYLSLNRKLRRSGLSVDERREIIERAAREDAALAIRRAQSAARAKHQRELEQRY